MRQEGNLWYDPEAWDNAQRWMSGSRPWQYEAPPDRGEEQAHQPKSITPTLLVAVMILTGILLQSLATLHLWERALSPIGGLLGILSSIPIARRLGWWKSIAWSVGAWLFVALAAALLSLGLAVLIGLGG